MLLTARWVASKWIAITQLSLSLHKNSTQEFQALLCIWHECSFTKNTQLYKNKLRKKSRVTFDDFWLLCCGKVLWLVLAKLRQRFVREVTECKPDCSQRHFALVCHFFLKASWSFACREQAPRVPAEAAKCCACWVSRGTKQGYGSHKCWASAHLWVFRWALRHSLQTVCLGHTLSFCES